MTRIFIRTLFVLLGVHLLWNAVHAFRSAPTFQWLLVGAMVALGMYRYVCHHHGRPAIPPSTVLCLRGFTYGLSSETLDRLYGELVAYLDAHPEIGLIAWDGDLNQKGSFATTIQRLLSDRPELSYVAFKKATSMHELDASYTEMNDFGVMMHGFQTTNDNEQRMHDATITVSWTPSAQLTVIGFPREMLVVDGRVDYAELSYAGLAWLRQTLGHTHVTIMTMGEGDIVKAEYERMHNGVIELNESRQRLFPDTTWVRLTASRSA